MLSLSGCRRLAGLPSSIGRVPEPGVVCTAGDAAEQLHRSPLPRGAEPEIMYPAVVLAAQLGGPIHFGSVALVLLPQPHELTRQLELF